MDLRDIVLVSRDIVQRFIYYAIYSNGYTHDDIDEIDVDIGYFKKDEDTLKVHITIDDKYSNIYYLSKPYWYLIN